LFPVFDNLEITAAVRIDDYDGFGTTTNPKVSAKFRPTDWLMFRGSYNTGFRVPSFNQIFNGRTEALYTGRGFADPETCSTPLAPNPAVAGCAVVANVDIISGGQPNLAPETSEQFTAGIVIEPSRAFSLAVDWWAINREGTIQILSIDDLLLNYDNLGERFLRGPGGVLEAIERTWVNSGSTRTQGIDVAARGRFDLVGGDLTLGLDGSYLVKKKEKVVPSAPFANRVGVFSFAGDLGLRWKHSAFVTWSNDDWSFSLSQLFRSGYKNQQLPGVASGAVNPPNDVERVDEYVTYNLSIGFTGMEGFRISLGVKNLFDTDPPFAVTYDSNLGSGSSWEPRVADPRGRAYTISVDTKF
jgi:iron complex outermembrane recepter protein